MKLHFGTGAALVTGGSGGIGSAVARQLARAGLPLALTYRHNRAAAEALIGELDGSAPRIALPWAAADLASAEALLRQAAEAVGPLRFVVHCSGVSQEAAFHTLAESALRELLETNLQAAIAVCRAAAVPLLKLGGGRIVLLGSVSGRRGIAGHTVYAATKAGLEGFARALAQEAAAFGVTVNCVAPGFIDTAMTATGSPERREGWKRRIPLGRMGRAEEVAQLVAYLLSDEAAYVTGQTLVIDGGISL